MTEIKFRAWDKDNFEFLDLDDPDVQIELIKDRLIAKVFNCGEGWTPDQGYFEKPSWDIANAEFTQYIGLKDKNGADAYICDIAKDEFGNIFEITDDYVLLAHLQTIQFEIIGNKYENSELLGDNGQPSKTLTMMLDLDV